MKRRGLASILCVAALSAVTASANGVTDWSAIAERVASEKRPPGSAEVILGLVHAAMYDAVAATQGGMRPLFATGVAAGGSPDVAASVAAHDVLKDRLPIHGAALDAELAQWMRNQPPGAATVAGEAAGHDVARAVIDKRAGDGLGAPLEYQQRERAAGMWEPTAAGGPVDYSLGRARPLVTPDATRFRPPVPNPADEAYARDLSEVRSLGRKDSTARTAAQTQTAMFWSDHTTLQWSRALRSLAAERGLDTRESARMLAMAHVAAADALISCFDAKYHYVAWRPIHAIRAGAKEGEAQWDSLLNVNHPEFPSGHSCFTGAITEALARYFGTRRVALTIDSTTTKTSRRYSTLDKVVDDVTEARILAGLHFRRSMLAGNKLGSEVAADVIARSFDAAP